MQKNEPIRRFSVNLWGWISGNSPGALLQVEERLTSHVYIRMLTKNLQKMRQHYGNKKEFVATITESWNNLQQDYFRNLCLSTPRRLARIIDPGGEMMKYSFLFNFIVPML